MSKKKIKVADLTLNQIVEIAEEHDTRCSECPLYNIPFLDCYNVCQSNIKRKARIKQVFKEKEIEIEKVITKEHQIKELKERIANMEKHYEEMQKLGSTPIMLGIIAETICELQVDLEKLEEKEDE